MPARDLATRALDPWPGATTTHGGQALKIFRARVEEHFSGPPGEILEVAGEGPIVGTGRGGLRLIEIQAAGSGLQIEVEYPDGERFDGPEGVMYVHSQRVRIPVRITRIGDLDDQSGLVVKYQVCNNKVCSLPMTERAPIKITPVD